MVEYSQVLLYSNDYQITGWFKVHHKWIEINLNNFLEFETTSQLVTVPIHTPFTNLLPVALKNRTLLVVLTSSKRVLEVSWRNSSRRSSRSWRNDTIVNCLRPNFLSIVSRDSFEGSTCTIHGNPFPCLEFHVHRWNRIEVIFFSLSLFINYSTW